MFKGKEWVALKSNDIVVEMDGQRLAVIVGRTGESQTAADKARDEALGRAGWGVYRLPPERVIARPQRAVGDILAALKEHGREVPKRVPAARRQGAAPAPVAGLKALCAELGERKVS
jgi:hypothetical protein